MADEQPDPSGVLSPDFILTAEFQYNIAQCDFQANEDRARVTSFYLVTLGSFIAALLGSQIQNLKVPEVYWAFVALFVILAIMSVLTLLQLVRLRQAWFDAVEAMNQIKTHYIRCHSELEGAFAWNPGSAPKRFKPWSVGFLLAFQVMLLGGASCGASVVFAGLAVENQWWWVWALLAVLACVGGQILLYRRLLRM